MSGPEPPDPADVAAADLADTGAAGDLARLEALADAGAPIDPQGSQGGRGSHDRIDPVALIGAVRGGHRAVVAALLARGADPNAAGPDGIEPLFVAAAAGHPALAAFLVDPFAVDVAVIRPDIEPPEVADRVAIAEALLAAGARLARRVAPTGLTPLMVATFFGRREVAALLLARGAEPLERDAWGRTADRFAVYPTIARAIRLCRRLPMVKAAYVAQLHEPLGHRFTSPVLGLELAALLPADAFEGWPADDPIVAFALADDAISRLVRLTQPVYTLLTLHQLVPGRRYRVLETIQGLSRGAIVVFRLFDDIDNHWGSYEFETLDGKRIGVGGDFSTPANSPLGQTYRYLEAID